MKAIPENFKNVEDNNLIFSIGLSWKIDYNDHDENDHDDYKYFSQKFSVGPSIGK